MKRKKRFERTMKVWINAFLNGTLQSGWCSTCAVGNLAADGLGAKYEKINGRLYCDNLLASKWSYDVCFDEKSNDASESIKATGYTLEELTQIEAAFEGATKIKYDVYLSYKESEILQDQFNGLVACFLVLCRIHQVDDCSRYIHDFKESLMVRL